LSRLKRLIVKTDGYLRWAIFLSPFAISLIVIFIAVPVWEILRFGDWWFAGIVWSFLTIYILAIFWSRLVRWAA